MSGPGTLEPVDVAVREAAVAPTGVIRVSDCSKGCDPRSGHWAAGAMFAVSL
jgi:hypothetical protein